MDAQVCEAVCTHAPCTGETRLQRWKPARAEHCWGGGRADSCSGAEVDSQGESSGQQCSGGARPGNTPVNGGII